jgi:hypothetical protein
MSIATPRPAETVLRGARRAEPMTVARSAETLRNAGVNLDPALVRDVAASPKRTAALRAVDFQKTGTAFDHILRIAKAGTLYDGTPSAALAADLFGLVGGARQAGSGTRCYGRTTHTIFTLLHPGEFARLVGGLAVDGSVKLADGQTIRWNPSSTQVNGDHADYLWGSLNQLIRFRELPRNAELPALSLRSSQEDYASQGQMANIYTRLFGKPHVNVQGAQAMRHLNEIVARTGPLLAEYGAHGGSVAAISPQNVALGIEAGEVDPQPHSHICQGGCTLGYVVMPVDEAKKYELRPIAYAAGPASYVGDSFDEAPAPRPSPRPARTSDAEPVRPASSLTERERRFVTDTIRSRNYNNNNACWTFGQYSRHPATRMGAVPERLHGTELAEMFDWDNRRSFAYFDGLYRVSLADAGAADERVATAYVLHSVDSDRPSGDTARFFDRDGHWLGTSGRGSWSSPRT